MSLYTGKGDRGTTELAHTKNVSKSDDRIELMGTIEELTSHLGLVKARIQNPDTKKLLGKIQASLITAREGVADPYSRDFKLTDEKTQVLESEIGRMEGLYDHPGVRPLPGGSELSAQIDIACSVARRCERALSLVSVRFGADTGIKKYLNRLSDYLYALARYTDAVENGKSEEVQSAEVQTEPMIVKTVSSEGKKMDVNEAVIQEVMRRVGAVSRLTLAQAKVLIERVEQEAERRGKKAVLAVCDASGNPIAVHVMDGAFLVSFNVAVKKAYTAVAVKMSTMELSRLTQPGGTFFGLPSLQDGNIVAFGGGVPLQAGGMIIGGLGISGGTGEEDHSLAEYALSILPEILIL